MLRQKRGCNKSQICTFKIEHWNISFNNLKLSAYIDTTSVDMGLLCRNNNLTIDIHNQTIMPVRPFCIKNDEHSGSVLRFHPCMFMCKIGTAYKHETSKLITVEVNSTIQVLRRRWE